MNLITECEHRAIGAYAEAMSAAFRHLPANNADATSEQFAAYRTECDAALAACNLAIAQARMSAIIASAAQGVEVGA